MHSEVSFSLTHVMKIREDESIGPTRAEHSDDDGIYIHTAIDVASGSESRPPQCRRHYYYTPAGAYACIYTYTCTRAAAALQCAMQHTILSLSFSLPSPLISPPLSQNNGYIYEAATVYTRASSPVSE